MKTVNKRDLWMPVVFGGSPSRWALAISASELRRAETEFEVPKKERYEFEIGERNINAHVCEYPEHCLIVVCVTLDVDVFTVVHEAVHVFQYMMDHIGEEEPAMEQEAYGIEFIARSIWETLEEIKAGNIQTTGVEELQTTMSGLP